MHPRTTDPHNRAAVDAAGPRRAHAALRLITVSMLTLGACSDIADPTRQPLRRPTPLASTSVQADGPCGNCIVGPVVLSRTTADPLMQTYDFVGDPQADYVLDVNDNGSRGLTGSVALNGVELVTPQMLGGNGEFHLRRAVTLRAQNTLVIRLEGKPGATMAVSLKSGTRTVGAEGATVRAPGGVSLSVPAGALSAPVELEIHRGAAPPGAEDLFEFAAPPVRLAPEGTQFAVPATLTVPSLSPSSSPAGALVYYFDELRDALFWQQTHHDPVGGLYSTPILHFSQYWVGRVRLGRLGRTPPYAVTVTRYPAALIGSVPDGNVQRALREEVQRAADQWTLAGAPAEHRVMLTPPDTVVEITARTPDQAHAEFGRDVLEVQKDGSIPDATTWYSLRHKRWIVVVNDSKPGGWGITEWKATLGLNDFGSGFSLEAVLAHEFGHVWGLDHYDGPSTVAALMSAQASYRRPLPLRCPDLEALGAGFDLSIADRCATQLEISAPPTARIAGAPATPLPTATARDAAGRVVAGVPVLFQVEGGGSVQRVVALTGADGRATPGEWNLAGPAGTTHRLHAVVANLAPDGHGAVDSVWTVTSVAAPPVITLRYADDFSGGLANWMPRGGGSWTTVNGELIGDYDVSCGSVGCSHAQLLLADHLQPGAIDWRLEVRSGLTQAYCCSVYVNFAKPVLWVSDMEKEAFAVGQAWYSGQPPATETTVLVSHARYPWQELAYLTAPAAPWTTNAWQTTVLEKRGNQYTVYFNGVPLYTVTRTFSAAPKVGFSTYGRVRMDDFKLYALP